MAKIVDSVVESRTVTSYFSVWKIVIVGIALGFIHWGLTAILKNFIGSEVLSGDIATVLTATVGLLALIRLLIARPIVVAGASAISLWGLSVWASGLSWYEMIAWEMLLYSLSYVLFAWIARYTKTVPVLIVIITVVVIIRITVTL